MEQSVKIHTILNCFVDLNLETNEMFPYDVNILSVSLDSANYTTEEGGTLVFIVRLNEPSALGIEEATVIISNRTTSNSDIEISGFPVKITWQEGEQEKVLSVPITRDFIEESDEQFMIGLTSLVNLVPGDFIQANVVVQDTTELRVIRILAANTNTLTIPRLDPNSTVFDGIARSAVGNTLVNRNGNFGSSNFIEQRTGNVLTLTTPNSQFGRTNNLATFSVIEGESVNVDIGLDQPSEYGVERVDVALYSILEDGTQVESPLVTTSTERLEWSIGEQYKTVTVTALPSSQFQSRRYMRLELRNVENASLNNMNTNSVEIVVLSPLVERRFSTINFGNIYRQRGSVLSSDTSHSETELELRKISDNQTTNTTTLYWLVELGTSYIDQYNNPLLSESSNYPAWPNYYFGVDENGNPSQVALKVTNLGIGDVQYGNNTYGPNESFYVTMSRDATTIVLPTNDSILYPGDIITPDNIVVTARTFSESRYAFSLYVSLPQFAITYGLGTSGPHGFQLRTDSSFNNLYNIGEFNLPNYRTVSLANANASALYSTYRNVRTRYNGVTCTTSFIGVNNVQDVRVKGLILLSLNSLNTEFVGHEIRPDNQFNPICSSNAGTTGGLTWSSIPFEIV